MKKLIRYYGLFQGALMIVSPSILCFALFKWWGLLIMIGCYLLPFKLKIYESIQEWRDEYGDKFVDVKHKDGE
jgi:hypothetical protein